MKSIFSIEVCSSNSLFVKFFLATLVGQGVINKNPTIWLNGAKPANTCIPPSFPAKHHAQPYCMLTLKYDSKYKKLAKIDEITFLYLKK